MLIESHGCDFWVARYRRCSKVIIKLFLFVYDFSVMHFFKLVPFLMIDLWLHISWLGQLTSLADFRLEFTIFELLFNFLQWFKIFSVGEDIMQSIELLVSIPQLSFHRLKLSNQNLFVSFNDRPYDSKKCQLLSFLIAKKLAIELNKLEEYTFEQSFSMIDTLLLIHQGYESVVNQSCWYVVVSKIDQFQ